MELRVNQSDGKDEWWLYKLGYKVMFLGVMSTGDGIHDHISNFDSIASYYASRGKNDFNVIHTGYIDRYSCLMQMENSNVFVVRSHGAEMKTNRIYVCMIMAHRLGCIAQIYTIFPGIKHLLILAELNL